LKKSLSIIDASETQGILLGFICINQNQPSKLERIMLDVLSVKQNQHVIINYINKLYAYNLEQLKNINKLLVLMIPNKEESLPIKLKYLRSWLKGFISGIGMVGLNKKNHNVNIIYEIINDFSMITYVNEKTSKEDEVYYLDLVEYVKISVEIIYFEIYNLGKNHSK
jgi:uncharacterized protein YgfB (UPF0149 family)